MRPIQHGACVVGALLSTGCYTLQPVAGGAPAAGREVAFDITDAGRVALGGSMGPAIRRVEGRLVRVDADAYAVSVTGVDFISGTSQTWSGETVTLKRDYVATSYARRFSPARTIALTAVGVGAVALIVTRSLVGGGTPDSPSPPPPGGQSSRGPRP